MMNEEEIIIEVIKEATVFEESDIFSCEFESDDLIEIAGVFTPIEIVKPVVVA